MMNLVDSSGWMEYFSDGPQTNFFKKPIEDVKSLLVPSICIYEVFKKTLQSFEEKKALEIVAVMRTAKVVDLDDQMAFSAASLSYKLKLPMADSIILATAHEFKATIWTMDADFKGLQGVNYIAKK
jgi:predicted nucleic acid-binding protein